MVVTTRCLYFLELSSRRVWTHKLSARSEHHRNTHDKTKLPPSPLPKRLPVQNGTSALHRKRYSSCSQTEQQLAHLKPSSNPNTCQLQTCSAVVQMVIIIITSIFSGFRSKTGMQRSWFKAIGARGVRDKTKQICWVEGPAEFHS